MPKEESCSEKSLVVEKFINELLEILREFAELKISEAKSRMAAEALREREEKYREVLKNLPQRIYLKSKSLAYVFCNESYARDLKIKPDEIAGKIDTDFYPEELAARYLAEEKRILNTRKMEELEERYVVSGQELTIRSVKIPLQDEEGKVSGLLGIFWDITGQKRAEEEKEKTFLALRELLAQRETQTEALNDQFHKEVAERQRMEKEFQGVRQTLEGQLAELKTALDRAQEEHQREVSERRRIAETLQQTARHVQTLMTALNDVTSGDQK